jgi:hypothetical protein
MLIEVVGDDPLTWVAPYSVAAYVAVIGSRRRSTDEDRDQVLRFIEARDRIHGPKIVLVSGGASKGADRFAEIVAELAEIDLIRFRPRRVSEDAPYYVLVNALFDRNTRIVELAQEVGAQVHSTRKGGTEDAVKKAHILGRPVHILHGDGTISLESPPVRRKRRVK